MENYRIYVPAFFESHRAFPFDVLGYTIPKYAQVHSYVCSMLAPLANRIEKPLLSARPTMRELERLSLACSELHPGDREAPFVAGDIYRHCSSLYDQSKRDRKDVAQEVLDCLRRFAFYQEWVNERLDYLWRQDLIHIPKKYLALIKDRDYDHGY